MPLACISRDMLFEYLKGFKMPDKKVKLIKFTLENTKAKVKVQGRFIREFNVNSSLKQGNVLLTILFNLCLEKITRSIYNNRRGTIMNCLIEILAFADDVDIITRNKKIWIEMYNELESETKKLGL